MLWDWSFFMATFSMIGSAPTRLLQHLPAADQKDFDEVMTERALNLFLQPTCKSVKGNPRKISRRMLWAWQCPAMLMSYSWISFLVGYTLHMLTPAFDKPQAQDTWKVRAYDIGILGQPANVVTGFYHYCIRLRANCS